MIGRDGGNALWLFNSTSLAWLPITVTNRTWALQGQLVDTLESAFPAIMTEQGNTPYMQPNPTPTPLAGIFTLDCDTDAICRPTQATEAIAPCNTHIATTTAAMSRDVGVLVGCAAGLFQSAALAAGGKPARLSPITLRNDEGGIQRVAMSPGGWISAATVSRVHIRDPAGSWWWEWVSQGNPATCQGDFRGGPIEANITALLFDTHPTGTCGANITHCTGRLWLGSSFGLQSLDLVTGSLQRYGRREGLPFPNITALSVAPPGTPGAGLWIGTARGLARLPPGSGVAFEYYEGERYLSGGDSVDCLANDGGGNLLVASSPRGGGGSSGGAVVLRSELWTLARKALHYQGMVSPRHDRFVL